MPYLVISSSYQLQRSCGQGNIFAPVFHSVHGGGVCLSACWDTTPPKAGPLVADTPQEQTPPKSRHPQEQTPPRSRHPLGADTPQEQTPPRKQTPAYGQ